MSLLHMHLLSQYVSPQGFAQLFLLTLPWDDLILKSIICLNRQRLIFFDRLCSLKSELSLFYSHSDIGNQFFVGTFLFLSLFDEVLTYKFDAITGVYIVVPVLYLLANFIISALKAVWRKDEKTNWRVIGQLCLFFASFQTYESHELGWPRGQLFENVVFSDEQRCVVIHFTKVNRIKTGFF